MFNDYRASHPEAEKVLLCMLLPPSKYCLTASPEKMNISGKLFAQVLPAGVAVVRVDIEGEEVPLLHLISSSL